MHKMLGKKKTKYMLMILNDHAHIPLCLKTDIMKTMCLICMYIYREKFLFNGYFMVNERKSEQAHIPHAPTLLENAVYNEWHYSKH